MPTARGLRAVRGRNLSVWALGIVRSQDRNLKKLTEGHHKEWSVRLNLTQRGAAYQGRMRGRLAAAASEIVQGVVHGRLQHVG